MQNHFIDRMIAKCYMLLVGGSAFRRTVKYIGARGHVPKEGEHISIGPSQKIGGQLRMSIPVRAPRNDLSLSRKVETPAAKKAAGWTRSMSEPHPPQSSPQSSAATWGGLTPHPFTEVTKACGPLVQKNAVPQGIGRRGHRRALGKGKGRIF